MATLYPNYIVIVQESDSPYAPNNDLEVLLYEGRVELKTDPTTGSTGVFNYGTSTAATTVKDKNGVAATAISTDSVNKPGEYKFLELDLNYGGSLSELGQTLYSVVGRPASDTALNSFERAKILQDRVALTDPNTKQAIATATGEFGNVSENLAYAGGTVNTLSYTAADGSGHSANKVYLELSELSDAITGSEETPAGTPPSWVGGTSIVKLVARIKAHYTNGTDRTCIWESIPIYKTPSGKYVIKIADDLYNVYKSADIGAGSIELNSIWQDIIVSTSLEDYNIRIKASDSLASVSSDFAGYTEDILLTAKKDSAGDYLDNRLYYLNGYSSSDYTWNQILAAPDDSVDTDYTNNPNRSKAVLADGSNCFSAGIINYGKWWPLNGSTYGLRISQRIINGRRVLFSFEVGSSLTSGQGYDDISWSPRLSVCPSDYTSFMGETCLGVGNFSYASDSDSPQYNIDVKGNNGIRVSSQSVIISTNKYIALYPYSGNSQSIESGYCGFWATSTGLKFKTASGTTSDILLQTAGISNHTIASHNDTEATGSYLSDLYGTDGTDGVVVPGSTSYVQTTLAKKMIESDGSSTYIYRDNATPITCTTSLTTIYGISTNDYIKVGTVGGDSNSVVINADSVARLTVGGSSINSFSASSDTTTLGVADGNPGDYILIRNYHVKLANTTAIYAIIAGDNLIHLTDTHAYYYGPGSSEKVGMVIDSTTTYLRANSPSGAELRVGTSGCALYVNNNAVFRSITAESYTAIKSPVSSQNSVVIEDNTLTLRPGNSIDRNITINNTQAQINHDESVNIRVDSENAFYSDSSQTRTYFAGDAFLFADSSSTILAYGNVDSSNEFIKLDTDYTLIQHPGTVNISTAKLVVSENEELPDNMGDTPYFARFVSQGSTAMSLESYSGGLLDQSVIYLQKSGNSTLSSLSSTGDQEYLGAIYFKGVNSSASDWSPGAFITATQTGDAGTNYCSTKLTIGSYHADGGFSTSFIEIDGERSIFFKDGNPSGGSQNPDCSAEYGLVDDEDHYYWRIPTSSGLPNTAPGDDLGGHMVYYAGDLYYWNAEGSSWKILTAS